MFYHILTSAYRLSSFARKGEKTGQAWIRSSVCLHPASLAEFAPLIFQVVLQGEFKGQQAPACVPWCSLTCRQPTQTSREAHSILMLNELFGK